MNFAQAIPQQKRKPNEKPDKARPGVRKLRGGKSIAKIIMIELQTGLNGSDRDRQALLQIRKTTSKLSSSGLIQAPNHT